MKRNIVLIVIVLLATIYVINYESRWVAGSQVYARIVNNSIAHEDGVDDVTIGGKYGCFPYSLLFDCAVIDITYRNALTSNFMTRLIDVLDDPCPYIFREGDSRESPLKENPMSREDAGYLGCAGSGGGNIRVMVNFIDKGKVVFLLVKK